MPGVRTGHSDARRTGCDDTAYGKGTGGQLQYDVSVPKGGRTLWFAIGGSDHGLAEAQPAQQRRSPTPPRCSARSSRPGTRSTANTRVSLPGDRLLQRSVAWSKQNLAESVQESRNLQVRPTNGGKNYPAPVGTVARARWYGAGFPDYPWLFATDGEYTSFAAVSSGQFATIKAHLRALRDVSVAANGQQRQGRARGDAGRPGLLRRQRRRRQHRRDREVPLDRGAGLAMDR